MTEERIAEVKEFVDGETNTIDRELVEELLASYEEALQWWELTLKRAEKAEAENTILREALQWIVDCWGRDEDDYCRSDMQGAINAGREALAKCPQSAQETRTESELPSAG